MRQQAIKLDDRETQAYYISKNVGSSSSMHSLAPSNNMMAKTFQAPQAKDRNGSVQLSEDSEYLRQKKHVHDTLHKKYGKVNIIGNKG